MEKRNNIPVTITENDWNLAWALRDEQSCSGSNYRISTQCPLALATLRVFDLPAFPREEDGCAAGAVVVGGVHYDVPGPIRNIVRTFDARERVFPGEVSGELTLKAFELL